MDVFGRNPDSREGKYFRANVWSWRPLHQLINELCADLLDSETLTGMGFNDGFGPVDPHVCRVMADRFADWLKTHPNGHSVQLGMWVTADNMLRRSPKLRRASESLKTAHSVTNEQLTEWIEFLRHCGGFEVW